jgi:cholesterol transport system auxiliary component
MSKNAKPSRFCLGVVLSALLSACATDPLPDYRYYRPAASAPVAALANPLLDRALEIEVLRADGMLGERPIAYTLANEPGKLSQYHYQLWTDPPGSILQRRLIDLFANYRVAPLVTPRASPRAEPYQLVGIIEQLERIKFSDERYEVAVALRLRLEAHRGAAPIVEKVYRKQLSVSSREINATVDAFGVAVDQIAADLLVDLQTAKR